MIASLLSAGCASFVYLGILGTEDCDVLERTGEEGANSAAVWFKVLFAPGMGLCLLILFLVEDFIRSRSKNGPPENTKTAPGSSVSAAATPNVDENDANANFWKRHRAKTKSKHKGLEPIRLTLVDSNGVGNRYKISPSTTMWEVLNFYCQRHDAKPDAICMRFQGKRLPLQETAGDLGLVDLTVIDVETDYHKVHEAYKLEAEKEYHALQKCVELEKKGRLESDTLIGRLERDLKTEARNHGKVKDELSELQREMVSVKETITKLERDVKTHQTHRKAAEKALSELQKELKVDKDRAERQKLEKSLKKAKDTVEEQKRLIEELSDQTRSAQDKLSSTAREKSRLQAAAKSVEDMRVKLAATEEECEKLRSKNEATGDELAQAQKDILSWVSKVDKLEKRVQAASQQSNETKSSEKELRAAVAELEAQRANDEKQHSEQTAQLKQEVAQMQQQLYLVDEERKQLREWKAQVMSAYNKQQQQQQQQQQAAQHSGIFARAFGGFGGDVSAATVGAGPSTALYAGSSGSNGWATAGVGTGAAVASSSPVFGGIASGAPGAVSPHTAAQNPAVLRGISGLVIIDDDEDASSGSGAPSSR